jgi:hypothetical protein
VGGYEYGPGFQCGYMGGGVGWRGGMAVYPGGPGGRFKYEGGGEPGGGVSGRGG